MHFLDFAMLLLHCDIVSTRDYDAITTRDYDAITTRDYELTENSAQNLATGTPLTPERARRRPRIHR
jgi:hypothetical protein